MTPLPRRPLVGLALAFVAGTGAGLHSGFPPMLPLGLGAAFTLVAALAAWTPLARQRAGPPIGTVTVLLVVACLGMAGGRLAVAPSPAPALTGPDAGDAVLIRATVTDAPMPVLTRATSDAYRFPATVTAVRPGTNVPWRAVSGPVRVRWYGPPSRLPGYGEEWQWQGRLEAVTPRAAARAPATPPPLRFSFTTTAQSGKRLSAGHGNPLVAWCLRVRGEGLRLITVGIRDFPEATGILTSLVLGYRSQVPTELYQAFASTGTLHVFAVSGSHVVVIGAAIVFVLSACGLPRTRWVLLLAPALIGYTIMTGLQPSAVRACVMGVTYAAAPLIHRRTDLYASLGLAALILLAIDPTDLNNVGFILSFVAVLGIGLFYPVFEAPLRRRIDPDPLQLVPDPRWKQLGRAGLHHLASLTAMSLAAWLATVPLTAWYFGLFSPIGLLGNLLAVPLASLILITGIVSLAGGSVALLLADIFNHANLVFASLLAGFIRLLAAIPYGHLQVPPPPLVAVIAWYAALLAWRFRLWLRSPAAVAPEVAPPES